MGADLILNCVRLPRHADGTNVTRWDDFVARIIDDRVRGLDDDTVIDLLDLNNQGVDPEDLDDDLRETARVMVTDAAKTVIEQGRSDVWGNRDAIAVSFDDPTRVWVLAGGTSWGDSPGDTFDAVHIVLVAGVLNDDLPPRA